MTAPGLPPKVLVVDDDPLVLRMISRWLGRKGYTIHTTDSGAEARRLVQEQSPALVITDLYLQGETTLALVDELEQTRTIVMSGDIEALPSRLQRHNLAALAKPFSPDRLDELMDALLKPPAEPEA